MTDPSGAPSPWPHPAAPGPAGTPGGPWSPAPRRSAPVGLGIASGVVAIVVALLELASAAASVPAAGEYADAIRAGGTPYDVVTWYDGAELLLLPALVAAYVLSCLWLQMARANTAFIVPGRQHQRRPLWVWLGWWVPIVSLWFPYQVVRDIARGSSRAASGAVAGLAVWWTAWLLYLIGNRAGANASTSRDLALVEALPVIEWLTAAACVLACVQWCRLVRRITTDQQDALS